MVLPVRTMVVRLNYDCTFMICNKRGIVLKESENSTVQGHMKVTPR